MDKLLLDSFSEHLKESLSILSELKEMAELEKKALIECDYDELDKVLMRRDQLLDKFQGDVEFLEKNFPKLAKTKDGQLATLSELSKFIDEPYSTLFKAFPGEFHSLVKVIHEANLRNLIVLNHCKELIYEFLCMMAQKIQPTKTYSSCGKIDKQAPPSFISSNL